MKEKYKFRKNVIKGVIGLSENIEDYNDQAHFEIEMDTMEMKE